MFAAIVAGEARAQATLEEVVVTARRRDEGQQEVPLAITALTAVEIERRARFRSLAAVPIGTDRAPGCCPPPSVRLRLVGVA